MTLISLSRQAFLMSARRPGFGRQLRSALSRSNNDRSFFSWFLSANALDLALAALTQEVETDTVIFIRFNQMIEAVFELEELHLLQLALKHTILHPLAEVLERLEDAAPALIILDVVRDNNKHILSNLGESLSLMFSEGQALPSLDKSLRPTSL